MDKKLKKIKRYQILIKHKGEKGYKFNMIVRAISASQALDIAEKHTEAEEDDKIKVEQYHEEV